MPARACGILGDVPDLAHYFNPAGAHFVATESTRGPWSREHQHGGPPAALLARAMEQLVGDDALLTRLTFDFVRPVPIAAFTVRAEVVRAGAKVRRLQATLATADGAAVAHEVSRRELSLPKLDERRLRILRLLAEGATTEEISESLRYSQRTIKGLVASIQLELHSRTRAQAVATAIRGELI